MTDEQISLPDLILSETNHIRRVSRQTNFLTNSTTYQVYSLNHS